MVSATFRSSEANLREPIPAVVEDDDLRDKRAKRIAELEALLAKGRPAFIAKAFFWSIVAATALCLCVWFFCSLFSCSSSFYLFYPLIVFPAMIASVVGGAHEYYTSIPRELEETRKPSWRPKVPPRPSQLKRDAARLWFAGVTMWVSGYCGAKYLPATCYEVSIMFQIMGTVVYAWAVTKEVRWKDMESKEADPSWGEWHQLIRSAFLLLAMLIYLLCQVSFGG